MGFLSGFTVHPDWFGSFKSKFKAPFGWTKQNESTTSSYSTEPDEFLLSKCYSKCKIKVYYDVINYFLKDFQLSDNRI